MNNREEVENFVTNCFPGHEASLFDYLVVLQEELKAKGVSADVVEDALSSSMTKHTQKRQIVENVNNSYASGGR